MSSSDRGPNWSLTAMRTSLITGLSVVALCVASAARAEKAPDGPWPITPTERYGIEVKSAPDEILLAAHASGLSPAQMDALRDFMWRWMNTDRGAITVHAPEHGPDQGGVYRTASAARDFLIDQGVPASAVQIVGYDAAGDARAPVRVEFTRFLAIGPECGRSWSNLTDTRSNAAYPEFGCAVTANIAAQIADPADLLHPRATDAPDIQRREFVLGKYSQGQLTSTLPDPQAQTGLAGIGQ
ncbi:MAG TPA: CpaD family pilus assembly protein [Caulobacteraceae bacterium]|nr:CpaD family pilus assembly protein [Caulobacteraceae bacterium]